MVDHPSPMLDHLDLPDALKYRVLCRNSPSADDTETTTTTSKNKKSFILYLPSVVLRKRHNAGFALACHLANHHKVPVLVLCSVLDDQMLSKEPLSPTVMTARRLAFTLEALQSCCNDFEEHGAGVAIRVHGPGARTPHHLSLAHKALAVVTDEPFVDPFRQYVQKVVKTCRSARVPCFSVDSSTSVPPKQFLKLSTTQTVDGDLQFTGAPNKAWRWEKQTSNCRQWHVFAATREGALDAPELKAKLPPNFFLSDDNAQESVNHDNLDTTTESLMAAIPSKWKDSCVPCPSQRPWTATELHAIAPKEWAMTEWEGADTSVSPCQQTHGSSESAKRRWKSFLETGLKEYAKKRNQIVLPQAVSRISCYLNLGILSVFDVLDDIWQAKSSRTGYSTGCQKFLDEIVKWREGSYVHAFAHPKYHSIEVLPPWSRRHLESLRASSCSASTGYTYEQLESSTTADETWNAMQSYLVETGELHNNARMTWGKTAVHWQARRFPVDEVIWQLVCLNDRFALDGLSPPSYGGLLWCFGWQDKPANGHEVSEKWAHRYRTGPEGFELAKENLLAGGNLSAGPPAKRPRSGDNRSPGSSKKSPSQAMTILSFFSPKGKVEDSRDYKSIIG